MNKSVVKYFIIILCAIASIYILDSCLVIDEQIKYGKGFKVIIQEKLFPSIFFKFIPSTPGDGSLGIWEVRVISEKEKLGPFYTSWLNGIEVREDMVSISEADHEIDIYIY